MFDVTHLRRISLETTQIILRCEHIPTPVQSIIIIN